AQVHNIVPKEGPVLTVEVAIRIAVAAWEPIYGASNIEKQKPYEAKLSDGIWYVQGSSPTGEVGGVAKAAIAQQTGVILRVSHGR
ncbi:unnamed protein product, partial [Phaeothamnion confervicola]